MESVCSLTSLDVYDWVSDLKQINLNEVHKNRRCELLLIAEKSFTASARMKVIQRRCLENHPRDVYIITLSDVYGFLENREISKIYSDEVLERIAKAACREAVAYLITSEPVPTDLLVMLLKLEIIYTIKKDIHDAQRDVVFDQTSRLFQNPIITGIKGKTPKKGAKSKTKKEGKGKKPTVEEDFCLPYLIPKPEESAFPPDSVTISDKVLYIVLMGFYMADIFEHLIFNEMILSCVVEISERSGSHPSSSSESEVRHVLSHKHYNSRQFKNKNDTLYTFWYSLYDEFFQSKRMCNSFIVTYTPMIIIKGRSTSAETNSQQMFEHFSEAIHKIDEYRMWHRNYLEKLKVLSLGETPQIIPVYCMDMYNDSLNEFPVECVNVAVVLESLLNEVCHRGGDNLGQRKSTQIFENKFKKRSDFRGQLKKLFVYLKSKNVKIPNRDFELLPSIKYTLKDKSPIIHEKNLLERNLHCYTNLHKALLSVNEKYLKMNACVKLWEKYLSPNVVSDDLANFNKQLKELSSDTELNPNELFSCITVFLFGKINCASRLVGNKPAELTREIIEMEKYFPNRNNDLQTLLNPEAEITDYKDETEEDDVNVYEQLLLHKFTWIEDLPSIVFLQELNKALNEFECVDHIYVPVFDSVHLHFHHNADKFGITLNKWSARIRSRVDLKTFLTFALHEDSEFVIGEQKRMEELNKLHQNIVLKEIQRINQIEIDGEEDFILKGSIKDQFRQASLQVDEKEVNGKKKKKGEKGEKPKKDAKKTKSTDSKPKKSAKVAAIDVRSIVESAFPIQVDKQDVENLMNLKFPPKYLNAYDFEERIAMNGSTTTFYSLDPMKVIVNRHMLTGKSPRISVNLTMNNHSMMMHAYVHRGFEFHYNLKNDITIAFGKEPSLSNSKKEVKKLQNLYLLNEKRIRSIKCINQNLLLKRKLLVKAQYLKQIIDMMQKAGKNENQQTPQATSFIKSLPSKESTVKSESVDFKISRKQFLEELKQLKATTSVFNPRFKICSSRLHKYSQIKRVISPMALQLQQIRKFLKCRDDCENFKLVQVTKCFPIPGRPDLLKNHPDFDLRITLGNGLHIRNVPGIAPKLYYINQFFIKKRPQHVTIATEESRTFLRCGFIAVKHLDGTLTLYAGNGRIIKFDVPFVKRRKKKFEFNNVFQRKANQNKSSWKFFKGLRRQLKRLDRQAKNGRDSQFTTSRDKYDCISKKIRYNSELSLLTLTDDGEMSFVLIMTDGKRIKFKKGKIIANNCYYVSKEEKIREQKSIFQREDGTEIVLTQEGYTQTTYVDGTRITTWFEVSSKTIKIDLTHYFGTEVEDMGVWVIIDLFYQFEHPNYATVTCSSTNKIMKLQMPGEVVLEHNENNEYLLKMDESTVAKISVDKVQVESLPCVRCERQYWCLFNITQLYQLQENISGEETLLMASDTYNKTFIVNYDGTCSRNDNYDQSETNCGHISHRKHIPQAFFVMKRECGGQIIWTDDMYKERLIESQLAPNQSVLFYTNQENSVVETAEFRVYEKERYSNRFTMPYLPTIIPYYKEPPFDFNSATFATQRLLNSIPDFSVSAPFYMNLTNQLLVNDITSTIENSHLHLLNMYLATQSDLISLVKEESKSLQKQNSRAIFAEKIARWKKRCELGRQAIEDFHTKPKKLYDFDFIYEPSDSFSISESSLSNQSKEQLLESEEKLHDTKRQLLEAEEQIHKVEEHSFRSMGTNTLIPFCFETEAKVQRKQEQEDTSSSSSEVNERENAQHISESLKNKLLDCISDILQNNYDITVDEESESTFTEETLEEQFDILKSDLDEGNESDASSVPEFLKGEIYRSVFKLFITPTVKKQLPCCRKEFRKKSTFPSPVYSNIDSIFTQADSWIAPKPDEVIPLDKTLSLKVLSSKVMHHPSYSDAELILKVKSSEMHKFRQSKEDVDWREDKLVKIAVDDLSDKKHHCRDCLGVPFITQAESLYKKENFLD